jgi:hypothetical protein
MLFLGCVTLLIVSPPAQGETIVFIEGDSASGLTEDTHIAAGSAATENYSDETFLAVDTENGEFDNNESRALVVFPKAFGDRDGQLPEHTKVEQAVLSLYIINEGGTLSAHVIQESWDNDTVSWSSRGGELGAWQAEGVSPPSCEAVAASSSQTPAYTTVNFDLTSAVQMWASAPSTNHGIVLVSDSTDGTDIISSENSTYPKARPTLTVTYTLGDAPDTTEGDTGKDTDSGDSSDSGKNSGKDSDTTEDTGTSDSGDANTDEGDTPPIGESPGEEASCGCLSVRPTSGAAWLLAGLLVAGWRRRRPLTEAA